jgi:acyl-CoA synthetase (AMP-forming)/AMP-acid ligase II
MGLIMSALESPKAATSRIFCLSDGPEPALVSDLGHEARRASSWLRTLSGNGGTVAALLTASLDCLAVLFGAFRAGFTLVSVPHPARGMGVREYLDQIAIMCAMTGATHLLADPAYLELLGGSPVRVHGFNEFAASSPTPADAIPGSFVQFTSGSTGSPRGIALHLEAIEANLTSMFDWLPPRPDGVICSWLPLSHDMGLIGFALYGLCSVSPPWSTSVDVVLLKPEDFLADPGSWLKACTDFKATSTAAPPFALRLAARALRAGRGPYDLSTLRSFVVGSEPVSAEGLRSFGEVAGAHGLPPSALCPGYGLAEASLAVAISSPAQPWSSVRVDPEALADRQWSPDPDGGAELVSCGTPLRDVQVRTSGDRSVGRLEINSPSLLSHYVGDPEPPVSPEGWLQTADLGHLDGDSVFIVGRTDDVFVIAGRNVDARELDAVAGSHPATRPGNAATVPDDGGRYVVVAEPNSPVADTTALREAAREIRVALVRRFAASPSAVVFIERGTLPKTPSGKVRRNHLQALWRSGGLAEVTSG